MHQYVSDNMLLTQELLLVPAKKFVYFSSIDIYNSWEMECSEDADCISYSEVLGMYSASKIFSETLVRQNSVNNLILRPTTFLGHNIRPNTTYRVLTEQNPHVYLSGASSFNYILHCQVIKFVEMCLDKHVGGTFNLSSTDKIRLDDICKTFGLDVTFGDHIYDPGNISTKKIQKICNLFDVSSGENLESFVNLLGDKFVGKR